MAPWLSNLVQIILMALGMVCIHLTLIIVGSRMGWFLWIGKRVLAMIRRKS